MELRRLTAFQVARFYEEMGAAGYSTDARFKAGTRLRQILKQAQKMRLVAHNVALAVPLTRHVAAEMQVWNAEEAASFLWAAQTDRLYALYHVALDTGAREGELFALEWADFDATRGTLTFIKSLEEKKGHLRVKETKTRASRRSVLLGRSAADALVQHRERMLGEKHGGSRVFCDTQGGWLRRPNVQRRSFEKIIQRAGVPDIRFHDIRHTTATLLLLAGVDVKTVAARLGHGSPEMVLKRYAHVLPSMQEKTAGAMDGFLSRRDGSVKERTDQ